MVNMTASCVFVEADANHNVNVDGDDVYLFMFIVFLWSSLSDLYS